MVSVMKEQSILPWKRWYGKEIGDIATAFDGYVNQYDSDLEKWLYDAPEKAAKRLATRLPPHSRILDVGCGTGLVGVELNKLGFIRPDGIDISSLSLREAERKGVYRHTLIADILKSDFFFLDTYYYDGIICVGVLTYLEDIPSVLLKLIKLVRTGGEIELTQRSDMYKYYNLHKDLTAMVDAGLISNLEITDPCLFLPKHEEYGEEVLVHYINFTVL